MKTSSFIGAILALFSLVQTAGAQTTHTVNLTIASRFDPANITINVGDTVRWVWTGGFHNVESGVGGVHNGVFRSGNPTAASGTEFEVTFSQGLLDAAPAPDGIYNYYCIVHVDFGMTGSVSVEAAGPAGPGDGDGDGDVDLDDYEAFQDCMTDPQAAGGATTHDVSLSFANLFTPPDVTIAVGDTVRWTWGGGFHNVESGVGGSHDGNFRSGSPTATSGTMFSQTFDQAYLDGNPMPDNLYPYYCIVHVDFGMIGSVAVEGDSCATFDFDNDGDVDFADFGGFQRVFQP